MSDGYLGNPLIKKTGTKSAWTQEQIAEYKKCMEDPIYFAEKYIKIVHVDKGLIPIELYKYQKDIIKSITKNRRVCVNTSRQAGKCVSGDTFVKLRNKRTGEFIEMPIDQLHESVKAGAKQMGEK